MRINLSQYQDQELNLNDISILQVNNLTRGLFNREGQINEKVVNKIKANSLVSARDFNKSLNNLDTTLKISLQRAKIKQSLLNNYSFNLATNLKKRNFFYYIWLPSKSIERRPSHIKLYGEIRRSDQGILPNQEYNCKCGMRIITGKQARNVRVDEVKKTQLNGATVLLATALDTTFIINSESVKYGKLTPEGLKKYQETLKVGGGTLLQQSNRILEEVFIANRKYLKFNYKLLRDKIIKVFVIYEIQDKIKEEEISINLNNYNFREINKIYYLTMSQIKEILKDFRQTIETREAINFISFGDIDI